MKDLDAARVRALAKHLDVKRKTVSLSGSSETLLECEEQRGEWLVLTEEEAEEQFDACLESYIDDSIIPQCEGLYARYFDREAWKDDTRHDGRGAWLAGYDGDEHEIKVGKVFFYIYRVN